MQIGATTVEKSIEFPQEIKNGLALWHSASSSGNISKETWNTDLKTYMHPDVHCSVIYSNPDLEAA